MGESTADIPQGGTHPLLERSSSEGFGELGGSPSFIHSAAQAAKPCEHILCLFPDHGLCLLLFGYGTRSCPSAILSSRAVAG